jgi:hypothetical protein
MRLWIIFKDPKTIVMHKLPVFLIALTCLSFTSCIIGGWGHYVSGNGNVVEDARDISDFTGVHLSSGIDVELSQGDRFEVMVEADENLQEYIETYKSGGMLVVGTERGVNIGKARSKVVHVTLPELEELNISSAGDCDAVTPFTCGDLFIDISSAGDLKMEVEARSIRLNISSSGDCRLAGEAEEFRVDLSSAGDLHAFDLIAARVDVSVSSAGDARVHATEEISMSVSSAGDIYYMGDARVTSRSKSSAGDIIKK